MTFNEYMAAYALLKQVLAPGETLQRGVHYVEGDPAEQPLAVVLLTSAEPFVFTNMAAVVQAIEARRPS